MIIPFNIKHRAKIESGEYKVRTASGKPARVVCWDYKSQFDNETIYVLITTSDGYEYGCPYTEDGRYIGNNENYLLLEDGRPDPGQRWTDKVREILKTTASIEKVAAALYDAALYESGLRMIDAMQAGVKVRPAVTPIDETLERGAVIDGTNGATRDDGPELKAFYDR